MEPIDPILPRREVLKRALGAGAAALAASALARAEDLDAAAKGRPADALAADEAFWARVRAEFDLDPRIVNLNHAALGTAPRSVHAALVRDLDAANRAPAHALWQVEEPRVEASRARLAKAFGCSADEVAITRNATEGLATVQLGLPLAKGDEVIATSEDYWRTLHAWKQRERRDGVVVKVLSLPARSPGADAVVSMFEKAITERTRAIFVTHVTSRSGQVLPVKRLCDLARQRGAHSRVDGAQSFAQLPATASDLGCDFFATSLHKWLGAPHGTGFLYVRRDALRSLWPLLPAETGLDTDIRKLEQIGTHPAAPHDAIVDALDWHERLGRERLAARLRFLQERWTKRLAAVKGARLFTSDEPLQAPGLGLVHFEGRDHEKLARDLLEKHGLLVAPIGGEPAGLRISPGPFTTAAEVDALAAAVEKI